MRIFSVKQTTKSTSFIEVRPTLLPVKIVIKSQKLVDCSNVYILFCPQSSWRVVFTKIPSRVLRTQKLSVLVLIYVESGWPPDQVFVQKTKTLKISCSIMISSGPGAEGELEPKLVWWLSKSATTTISRFQVRQRISFRSCFVFCGSSFPLYLSNAQIKQHYCRKQNNNIKSHNSAAGLL